MGHSAGTVDTRPPAAGTLHERYGYGNEWLKAMPRLLRGGPDGRCLLPRMQLSDGLGVSRMWNHR